MGSFDLHLKADVIKKETKGLSPSASYKMADAMNYPSRAGTAPEWLH